MLKSLRRVVYTTLSATVKGSPPRGLHEGSLSKPSRVKGEATADALRNPPCRGEKQQQVGALTRLCEEGQLTEAVEALGIFVQRAYYVGSSLFYRVSKRCIASVLKRCIADKDIISGKRVHAISLESGHAANTFLANHIIRMYASHGNLEEAMQAFTKVATPTIHMWASIVQAHAEHGQPKHAIGLYEQMARSSVKPNSYVLVAALRACAIAGDLASGKRMHNDVIGSLLEHDVFVGSCLVDMYAKCGSLEDARAVFDRLPTKNVVTWNAMIGGYAHHRRGQEALNLFANMQRDVAVAANHVTCISLLQACGSLRALHEGKNIHAKINDMGLEADVVVGSCLVDMYAKCGSPKDGRSVFDRLPTKNVVTWTAMIAGYAQQGLGQEALQLFAIMQNENVVPNELTYVCLLKACASVGALYEGKEIHSQIQRRGLERNVIVGNALVDMYAKCGRLGDARRLFDALPIKNVVTWNALLNGYAQHCAGQMALQLFEDMRQQGVKPDDATYLSLLVACSQEGLVDKGKQYFNLMMDDDAVDPTVLHYNCIVDLLCRSGQLDEAENILRRTPFENPVGGWRSLLFACNSHNDVHRGRRCFDYLATAEPQNATAYVLMSSIYANAGMWVDVDMIESLRMSVGAWKKPAQACIEVRNQVHEFTVGDERPDVATKLRSINLGLKEDDHVPQTELLPYAIQESQEEGGLCGHAEKLALAYGLLNTPDGTTLLVTKNLRMCNDCHTGTKVLSRLEKREIVVRDARRVHRFKDGFCSCGAWN